MLKPNHVNICKKTYWQELLNGPAHCLKLSFNKEGATEKVYKFHTPGAMFTTLYFLHNFQMGSMS